MTIYPLLKSILRITVISALSITLIITQSACRSSVLEPIDPQQIRIGYSLPSEGHIKLEILNSYYTRVRILVDEVKPQGSYFVEWDYKDDDGYLVLEGIYIIRFTFADEVVINKIMYPIPDE